MLVLQRASQKIIIKYSSTIPEPHGNKPAFTYYRLSINDSQKKGNRYRNFNNIERKLHKTYKFKKPENYIF